MGHKLSKPVHVKKPVVYKQKLSAKYLNQKKLTENQYSQDYKVLHTSDGGSTLFGKKNNPIYSAPIKVSAYQVTENHLWVQTDKSKIEIRICDLRSGNFLAVEWKKKIEVGDKFAISIFKKGTETILSTDVAAIDYLPTMLHFEDKSHFFLPQELKYGFTKDASGRSEFWVNYAIQQTGVMDVFEPIYHQSGLLKFVIQDEKTVIATKIPFPSDYTSIGPNDFFRTSDHQVLIGEKYRGMVLAEIKNDEIHISDAKPILALDNKFYMHPSPARNAVILDVYRQLPSRGRFDYRTEFAEFQFISFMNQKWEKVIPSKSLRQNLNKMTFVKWLLDSEHFVMKDKKDVYFIYSIANNKIAFVKELQLSEAQQIMEEGIVVTSAIVEDSKQKQVLQLTGEALVDDDISLTAKEILTASGIVMPDVILNMIEDYRPSFPNMRFFPKMPLDAKAEATESIVIPAQKGLKTL